MFSAGKPAWVDRIFDLKKGVFMPEVSEKAIDPVCGMSLETTEAPLTSELDGKVYYFCGEKCKEKFDASPKSYQKKSAA